MALSIWSATDSSVKIDSADVEGLQSIDYKVSRSRQDVFAEGKELRVGVVYGNKIVTGTLRIKSTCKELDDKLHIKAEDMEKAKFTMTVTLKRGGHTRTLSFQECYLDGREYTMDVNGVGIGVYTFSALDVTES